MGNGTCSQQVKTSQFADGGADGDAERGDPGVAFEEAEQPDAGTATVPSVMPSHGHERDEQRGGADHDHEAHERRARRAATPGPARVARVAPTSSTAASTAMASPSQNGRKPEPGPFGAPVREYWRAPPRTRRRRPAGGAPPTWSARRTVYFFTRPGRPAPSRTCRGGRPGTGCASSPVHSTGVSRLRLM